MRGNFFRKIKPFIVCLFAGTLFVGGSFTAGYFINLLIKEKGATSLELTYSQLSFTFEQDSAAEIEAPTLVDNNQAAATATFSSSPALPDGLTLNTADGSITGTPSGFQTSATYEITATGTGVWQGLSDTEEISIQINRTYSGIWLTYSASSFTFTQEAVATITTPTLVDNNGFRPTANFSSVPALPTGLTLNTDGSVTGAPSGFQDSANYDITATGTGEWNGLTATERISIQITRVYTSISLTYSASSFTFTQETAASISAPTLVDNNGFRPTVTFSSSPELPEGLGFNADGSITGTPSGFQTSATYEITAQGTGLWSALSTSQQLSIQITRVYTGITLSYSASSFTFTQDATATISIPTLVDNNGFRPTANFSSVPALPTGLTLNTDGSVTGAPSGFQDSVDYEITATGTGAWSSLSASQEISIQITRVYTSLTLTYSITSFTFTQETAASISAPTVVDNNGDHPTVTFSSSPALPTGLGFNSDGSITGTPSVFIDPTDYTITAQGTGLWSALSTSQQLSIQITRVYSSLTLTYSITSFTFTQESYAAISTPTLQDNNHLAATATFSSAPALPAGLTLSTTEGSVSGTPSGFQGSQNYTITASGTGVWSGLTATEQISIQITRVYTGLTLTYSASAFTFTQNSYSTIDAPDLVDNNQDTATASYSITPALPAGLTLNTGGSITGVPSGSQTSTTYTITATGTGAWSALTTTAQISIQILTDFASISLTYSQTSFTFTQESAATIDAPTVEDNNDAPVTATFSCSTDLPDGLTLNTDGSITGVPSSFQATTNYTITATGTGNWTGLTDSEQISIQITRAYISLALTYAQTSFTFTQEAAASIDAPTLVDNNQATATATFSTSTALPNGLTFNTADGSVTGTPSSFQDSINYTITATGTGDWTGLTATEQISIQITRIYTSIWLTYSQTSFTFSQGSPASITAPTLIDNNEMAATATFSTPTALPDGLTLNADGSITGTPTGFQDSTNYAITATGTGAWTGLIDTKQISIEVQIVGKRNISTIIQITALGAITSTAPEDVFNSIVSWNPSASVLANELEYEVLSSTEVHVSALEDSALYEGEVNVTFSTNEFAISQSTYDNNASYQVPTDTPIWYSSTSQKMSYKLLNLQAYSNFLGGASHFIIEGTVDFGFLVGFNESFELSGATNSSIDIHSDEAIAGSMTGIMIGSLAQPASEDAATYSGNMNIDNSVKMSIDNPNASGFVLLGNKTTSTSQIILYGYFYCGGFDEVTAVSFVSMVGHLILSGSFMLEGETPASQGGNTTDVFAYSGGLGWASLTDFSGEFSLNGSGATKVANIIASSASGAMRLTGNFSLKVQDGGDLSDADIVDSESATNIDCDIGGNFSLYAYQCIGVFGGGSGNVIVNWAGSHIAFYAVWDGYFATVSESGNVNDTGIPTFYSNRNDDGDIPISNWNGSTVSNVGDSGLTLTDIYDTQGNVPVNYNFSFLAIATASVDDSKYDFDILLYDVFVSGWNNFVNWFNMRENLGDLL